MACNVGAAISTAADNDRGGSAGLGDAVSDNDVALLPPTATDLSPSASGDDRGPLLCQVTPTPIVFNPGARLHIDTGAQPHLTGVDDGPAAGFQAGAHGDVPSAE